MPAVALCLALAALAGCCCETPAPRAKAPAVQKSTIERAPDFGLRLVDPRKAKPASRRLV